MFSETLSGGFARAARVGDSFFCGQSGLLGDALSGDWFWAKEKARLGGHAFFNCEFWKSCFYIQNSRLGGGNRHYFGNYLCIGMSELGGNRWFGGLDKNFPKWELRGR